MLIFQVCFYCFRGGYTWLSRICRNLCIYFLLATKQNCFYPKKHAMGGFRGDIGSQNDVGWGSNSLFSCSLLLRGDFSKPKLTGDDFVYKGNRIKSIQLSRPEPCCCDVSVNAGHFFITSAKTFLKSFALLIVGLLSSYSLFSMRTHEEPWRSPLVRACRFLCHSKPSENKASQC